MKCRYCGQQIPEGILYCKNCGNEVRIVPDYNPLDDMLSEEIKGSITAEIPSGHTSSTRGTRNIRNTKNNRSAADRTRSEKERRRRQAERRKALKRKKRKKLLIIMFVILVMIIGGGVAFYQTSYTGIVKKGYKATEAKEYSRAVTYFEKAISKKPEKPEAYTGLSKVYIAQDDLSKAENVFDKAIEEYPKNVDIYEAFIQFYIDTDQQMEIPELLDDAQDSVRESLAEYIISPPSFSLDDEEVYDDVQQLSLTAKNMTIYYTTDGSAPTTKSQKYTDPIQLEEGETEIKAISVNKKGIPSLAESKTYTIELPIEDAPAVSPSTGQYEGAQTIEIKVPDGYEAYYTMDGSDPTTASTKYTGPIDMPDEETLFKAVLVNSKGRMSGITTRNYVRDTQDEEE